MDTINKQQFLEDPWSNIRMANNGNPVRVIIPGAGSVIIISEEQLDLIRGQLPGEEDLICPTK